MKTQLFSEYSHLFQTSREKAEKPTLLSKRIRSRMITAVLLGLMDCMLFLTDFLVSGRILGDQALSGLTVMNPIITFLTFANNLLPVSTAMAIALAHGKGNREAADRLYGQGLITVAISGALFSGLLFLYGNAAFLHTRLSAEIADHAKAYCMGLISMPFVMFLNTWLFYILSGEGYGNVCVVSSVGKLLVNTGLDIVLCREMGTFGVGLATMLGYLVSLLIKLIPVLGKRLSLRFRWHIDGKEVARLLAEGFSLSADTVCPVMFSAVMNALVLTRLGEPGLVVFSVILNVESLYLSLFSCMTNMSQPVICEYYAGPDYKNLRRLMVSLLRYLTALYVCVTGLMILLSCRIPGLFGISDRSTVESAVKAVRCYAPFLAFLGFATLLSRYYVCIGHRVYGFCLLCLSMVVLPVFFFLACDVLWGEAGAWIGLGAGYLASFFLNFFGTGILRKSMPGNRDRLLLCDCDAENRQLSYQIRADSGQIMACVHDLNEKLQGDNNLAEYRRNRLVLMAEEIAMDILDRNPEGRTDLEISVLRPADPSGQLSLIIRSNGFQTDITDDSLTAMSLREYVLATAIPVMGSGFFLAKKEENTVIAVTLTSIFPKYFEGLKGSQEMGTFMIYIFFAAMGCPADLRSVILNAPLIFVFCTVLIIVNMLVTFISGKFLRQNIEELSIAVNACVGGLPRLRQWQLPRDTTSWSYRQSSSDCGDISSVLHWGCWSPAGAAGLCLSCHKVIGR